MLLKPGKAVGTEKMEPAPEQRHAEARRLSAEDPGPNPGLEREH